MLTLKRVIQWIASRGIPLSDSDDQRTRKGIFNVASFSVGIIFIVLMGPFYITFREPVSGWSYIFTGVFVCGSMIFFKSLWGEHYDRYFNTLSFLVLPLHLLVHITLGGFIESGGILLWGLAHPVVTDLMIHGPRSALRWFVLFFLNLLIGTLAMPYLTPTPNLPPTVKFIAFALSIGMISFVIIAVLAYFVSRLEQAYQLLSHEQAKSENLLLNILPKEIATILKNESRTIADHYDWASILFADMVNFTPMSAEMSPVEMVDLLNEIFTHFDSLIEKYQLEKIKTVGDCYMVAAGVPRPRADHAQAIIHLALDMREYLQTHTFHASRPVNFRIGINSGSVLAGVIGRKKFIYDLWGDAVNTASRMESHGQAGLIQITRATYELVKDDFECEPRGTVNVKGKGEMEVWAVLREADKFTVPE
ncbi:MAG: hypothetical protein Fur0022_43830 [Anaerolineales bacterium]